MPDNAIVTRCPQCKTAFRVTKQQLSIAKGAVRCGSCLCVFRGLEHEVSSETDKPTQKPTAIATKSVPSKPKTAATKGKVSPESEMSAHKKAAPAIAPTNHIKPDESTDTLDEELLLQDDDANDKIDQDNDDFYFFDKQSSDTPQKTAMFGTTTVKPVTRSTQEKADESWALDMLAELEEDDDIEPLRFSKPAKKKGKTQEEAQAAKNKEEQDKPLEAPKPSTRPSTKPSLKIVGEHLETPDSPLGFTEAPISTEDLIDLDKPLQTESTAFNSTFKKTPEKTASQAAPEDDDLTFFYDDSFENSGSNNTPVADGSNAFTDINGNSATSRKEEGDLDIDNLISDEDIDMAMNSTPSYKQEIQGFIDGIQAAPVEMSQYDNAGKLQWIWKTLAIVLFLGFALQMVIFRFDHLSKQPAYRDFFITACDVIGCEVAELLEPDKIRTSNLIVRSHPSIANTLLIDVILINNANFEQPYPTLVLEFSDINNQILAGSHLAPSQYLRGELAGNKQMPINQPVQVSLSIQDPGSAAVNYQLNTMSTGP